METSFAYPVPTLQVRGSKLLAFEQWYNVNTRRKVSTESSAAALMSMDKFRENAELLKDRAKYIGQMTAGAKKRLLKAISLLVHSTPRKYTYSPITKSTVSFQLSFITLTTPDVDQAKDAKFCHKYLLEPMLRVLRRKYGMKSYIWKCELQKNESIHYHLTSDCFVPHTELREQWNHILRRHNLLSEFRAKYGHDNPNSTDVHSTRDVKNMEAYLAKYIAKEYQNEKRLQGKVWDASSNIKAGKYYQFELDSVTMEKIDQAIARKECAAITTEHCTIFKFKDVEHLYYYLSHVKASIFNHYKKIQSWVKSITTQTNNDCKKLDKSISILPVNTTNGTQLRMKLISSMFGTS